MNNYFRTNEELIFITDRRIGSLDVLTYTRDQTLDYITSPGNRIAKQAHYVHSVVVSDVEYTEVVWCEESIPKVPLEMTFYYRTKDYRDRDLVLKVQYSVSVCGNKYIAACDNVLYRVGGVKE